MSENPEQQDYPDTELPGIPEDEENTILPDLTTAQAGEQPGTPRDEEAAAVAEPAEAENEDTSASDSVDNEASDTKDSDEEDSDSADNKDADGADKKDGEGKKDEPDITNPGKLVRLGHMHAKILEELKSAETDPAGRKRLAQIHENTIEAMKEALGQDLEDEFLSFTPKLSSYSTPSHSELLMAQAGLVGWIEGLLQSIQTAIMARQAMHEESPAHPEHPVKHTPEGAYGPGNYL